MKPNCPTQYFLPTLLLCLLIGLCVNWGVNAQSDSFVMESEKHWDTYGIGGTCIPGGHNLAIADVDGDGIVELATGGFAYDQDINGTQTPRWAPFKIWTWDGANVNLEENSSWPGYIGCTYTGDADGDGKSEILTIGPMINSSGSYSSLKIWSWDGQTLASRGSYEGNPVGIVSVGDVDGDGKPEIVTTGTSSNNSREATAQLTIFRLTGNSLAVITRVNWDTAQFARANSVYTADLNNDGISEILTTGYTNFLNNSHGQLRVWQFDRTNVNLKSNNEWYTIDGAYSPDVAGGVMGNTLASTVKVGDVDGDGTPEIVTAGFSYNGSKAQGQLRIYNWTQDTLNLEKSQEWVNLDITQPTSVAINDVDGDGKQEIMTSGGTAGYGSWAPNAPGKTRAELKVWSWEGNTLMLKQTKDWIFGDAAYAWSVNSGDLDKDGTTEIVTIGCIENGTMCDPDMRIWNLPAVSQPFAYLSLAVIGAAATAAVVVVVAVLLLRKRR